MLAFRIELQDIVIENGILLGPGYGFLTGRVDPSENQNFIGSRCQVEREVRQLVTDESNGLPTV